MLSDKHYVLTNRGQVKAKDLKIVDKIIVVNGKLLKITKLIKPKAKKRIKCLTKKEISNLKKKLKKADEKLENI